jgi:integrase
MSIYRNWPSISWARTAPTVGDVADLFLKDYVPRLKPSTQRNYQLAIKSAIRPRLGALSILDVTRTDVIGLHHHLKRTPVQANRVLAAMSKLMTWSEERGYRSMRSNPCYRVKKYAEHARKRYLTPAEIARLGAALRVAERWERISPIALTALRLLFFTGARVSEILTLHWREVDLSRGELQLEDSKTGRKTILLNAPALALLKAWEKDGKHAATPYVFPGEGRGPKKGQHRVDLKDAWAWIRRRARLADVRLHDLRHSFASIAVSSGQTLPIVGGLLGHSQPATTSRYAHLMNDPLRAASEATGARIAAGLSPRRPGRVVGLAVAK